MTSLVSSDVVDDLDSDVDELAPTPKKSARAEIRHQIATDTMKRRDRFLLAKMDYFLPLLPEHNYIKKLVDAAAAAESKGGKKLSPEAYPYEELESQPKGYA
jgi:SWI/SNF-related matrix-associated actin-dependent regulator of chromatin subfamily A member 5